MSAPEKATYRTPMLLLFASVVYLQLNLFASPRVPFLLGGDQVYFWMNAMRMLDGRRVYQDFLQFTPPGTDLLYFTLFKLFGLRLWVTSFVVLLLGLAFVWLVFSIARKIMPPSSAVLASAVFLVPIYSKALNATHHWFGVLLVLAAIRAVLAGTTPSTLATSGALLGMSSFFSLYHGAAALLALATFLLWDGLRTHRGWASLLRGPALLFAAYLISLGSLSSPYLEAIGVRQLWYFQVTYIRDFVAHAQQGLFLGLPLRFTLHNMPALSQYLVLYLLLPAATATALYLCWTRRRRAEATESVMLLALVALFLLAEIAMSPNWLRLYAVSAPAVILLVWVIRQSSKLHQCATIALWVWIVVLALNQTMARHRIQSAIVTAPAGRVATTQAAADKLNLVAQLTKPGDAIFQAAWPGVYLPLLLRNPLYFDTVGIVDMPRPGNVRFAVQQLEEKRVLYVMWSTLLDPPCLPSCSDRLSPLRDYLHNAYAPVQALPDGDTLWRRR